MDGTSDGGGVLSTRGSGTARSSARPLVLLLLTALTVALGPAPVARSGPAPAGTLAGSSISTSAALGHDDTTPPSSRPAPHAAPTATGVDRPTPAAVLAAFVLAGLLVAFAGARPFSQRGRGLAARRRPARAPPAPAV